MDIASRFQKPDGWQWAQVTPREDQSLRFGWVAPKGVRALCVIFPGLSEYCEKYFETAHDLMDRGFAVAVIDWRGQGLSWRHLPDHDKRHHDDFSLDVEDARAYLAALSEIPALAILPRIVLGHSMGGHIALRIMHDVRDAFKCAALTAPMFNINLPVLMQGPARMTAEAACKMGWSEHYVFGYGPWSLARFTANLNLLTSDKTRREIQIRHQVENPSLRMGGLTFNWVRTALASNRFTQDPAWLSQVTTPLFVAMPSREMIVSNAATRFGVNHMPNVELVEITGSLHEVLMEKEEFRARFWQGFDAFTAKYLGFREQPQPAFT
ncbi:MAG: alpha/beta hydrolase [Alphaproteobacteria bacterium]|nr:alpha/beta hydrolase [Alphaproteobacteria bacterium]